MGRIYKKLLELINEFIKFEVYKNDIKINCFYTLTTDK